MLSANPFNTERKRGRFCKDAQGIIGTHFKVAFSTLKLEKKLTSLYEMLTVSVGRSHIAPKFIHGITSSFIHQFIHKVVPVYLFYPGPRLGLGDTKMNQIQPWPLNSS